MKLTLSAYPNPFTDHVRIEITTEQQHDVILRMTEAGGRLVKLVGWELQKGKNTLSLSDMHQVVNGIYFLDVLSQDGQVILQSRLFKYSIEANN